MAIHIEGGTAIGLCQIYGGAKKCSFSGENEVGRTCLKGGDMEATIQGSQSSMLARGDNCSGPPDFTPNKKT